MNNEKQFNEKIRQIGLLLVIVFFACLIIEQLRYFAGAMLGAFTFYIILRKPYRLMIRKGWNKTLATTILMIVSCLILLLFLGGITSVLYSRFKDFQPQIIVNTLDNVHQWCIEKWNYNIFSEELIQKGVAFAGQIIPKLLSASGSVLANVGMMMFILFFMLSQSLEFEKFIEQLIPLHPENTQSVKTEANSIILANAIGIPLVMIGQGLTAALAYWIFDAGDPVIWGLFTGFCGLIPVVGTGVVWLPIAINLILGGQIWQGIGLIVYGAAVISNVDNVVRMVFLQKKANIHPLLTIFGILFGMNLFGFWGIIFGPLLLSGFFLILKIYKKEFFTT
ncbi:AI-2E family transporter [Bacteroidia bacterium]|nr:AI-2E family transporter [Bacteroidia bacterium]